MAVTDPRERYADLREWHVEEEVDAETLSEKRASEAFQSGWVATGFVFDDANRLLLVYDADSGQWLTPGGSLHPGEALEEGLAREVREETGVIATAEKPHGVADVVARNGEETTGFTVVFYEATAETIEIGDDLVSDDEAFVDADWFEELPEDVYNRDGVEEILERCGRWEWRTSE